ncbi:MAG TPA: NRDE family protein [Halioglobus sp.]
MVARQRVANEKADQCRPARVTGTKKTYYQPVRSDAQLFPHTRRLQCMCLMIFAHQISLEYPLLVAANRDEFHSRPTVPSEFWAEYPQLLAGRDLQQGGTWMGMTRSGRFAAVTNFRDPSRTSVAPRSRGQLPLEYLTATEGPQAYLHEVTSRAGEYAGFNLLVGDRHSLWYFSNSDGGAPRSLPPGVYGLSNASLDTPWPKVELGKANLLALLDAGAISHSALASVVADRHLADQCNLSQGPGNSMEPQLSAQFIVTDAYGTRSSTTVWTDTHHRVNWRELSFDARGEICAERQQAFFLGPA